MNLNWHFSRQRSLQLLVLLASLLSTIVQLVVSLEVAVVLNVLLLGLVFGTIYWAMRKRLYALLMLGLLISLNAITLFGLFEHGLEVYRLGLAGAFSSIYLLPLAMGVLAPIVFFWGLYELQKLRKAYRQVRV